MSKLKVGQVVGSTTQCTVIEATLNFVVVESIRPGAAVAETMWMAGYKYVGPTHSFSDGTWRSTFQFHWS